MCVLVREYVFVKYGFSLERSFWKFGHVNREYEPINPTATPSWCVLLDVGSVQR